MSSLLKRRRARRHHPAHSGSAYALVALLVGLATLCAPRAQAQGRPVDRYDETFRKYSKRHFGPAFDWRLFKAQGLAESNLDSLAKSPVGARGVMQLMPTTFREIVSRNPDLRHAIDDPEWNIAAGISYDRRLWQLWAQDSVAAHRSQFMFASYNAGRGTILGAQTTARAAQLDWRSWPSIERVAEAVPRWRHLETLGYLRRIDSQLQRMDEKGRVVRAERR